MSEEVTKVTMPRKALFQAKRVLAVMGPLSINRLIEAIDAGKIDGGTYCRNGYPIDGGFVDYDTDERVVPERFIGCFLGWAGFLEGLNQYGIWRRLEANFDGKELTGELEFFVAHIHESDTAESNPYLKELRRVVVKYLRYRKVEVEA